MIRISPVNFNSYRTNNAPKVASKGFFSKSAEEITKGLLDDAYDDEIKQVLIDTTITPTHPVYYWNSDKLVEQKTPKQIMAETQDKQLKHMLIGLTDLVSADLMIYYDIPDLQKYAQKGEPEKTTAINLLLDLINSQKIREGLDAKYAFYGMNETKDAYKEILPGKYKNTRTETKHGAPGYLGLYKELTKNS